LIIKNLQGLITSLANQRRISVGLLVAVTMSEQHLAVTIKKVGWAELTEITGEIGYHA